jgi:hypothetical protein
MPRGNASIKKMMPKGGEDTDALNEMFEQMTGTQNSDPDIIIPKFLRLNNLTLKFIKIYKLLLNFNEFIDNFQEYTLEFDEIAKFADCLSELTNENITEYKIRAMNSDQVNLLYKTLKNKKELQTIIVTSGNLGQYKRYLSNNDDLKDDFIKREPGLSLKPLSFTQLDIKILWSSDKLTNMAKKYILNILSHTYKIGLEMYDVITSPDIDIKKFSKVLISNIEKMKKQIPRCEKAFNIIQNSVEMLEDNFKGYYKNSVESSNPSIIIESFIIDVSMSQKSNASITGQFRKIIMHMKKMSANNNDPRVKKLFGILNTQFSAMSKQTGEKSPDDEDEKVPDCDKEEEEEEVEEGELEDILSGLMSNINSK